MGAVVVPVGLIFAGAAAGAASITLGVGIAATTALIAIGENSIKAQQARDEVRRQIGAEGNTYNQQLGAHELNTLSQLRQEYAKIYTDLHGRKLKLDAELAEVTAMLKDNEYTINNLGEIFNAIHKLAANEETNEERNALYELLNAHKSQIIFLLNWSILELAILRQDELSTNLILEQVVGLIDFSVRDENGKSLLEYASLLEDKTILLTMQANQASRLQQNNYDKEHEKFKHISLPHVTDQEFKLNDLNTIFPSKYTLLTGAFKDYPLNKKAALTLLNLGANPLLKDGNGIVPLVEAVKHKDISIFDAMLANLDLNLIARIMDKKIPLNVEELITLLNADAASKENNIKSKVNFFQNFTNPGDLEYVLRVFENLNFPEVASAPYKLEDINKIYPSGRTLLNAALDSLRQEDALALMTLGANVHLKDKHSTLTPYQKALQNRDLSRIASKIIGQTFWSVLGNAVSPVPHDNRRKVQKYDLKLQAYAEDCAQDCSNEFPNIDAVRNKLVMAVPGPRFIPNIPIKDNNKRPIILSTIADIFKPMYHQKSRITDFEDGLEFNQLFREIDPNHNLENCTCKLHAPVNRPEPCEFMYRLAVYTKLHVLGFMGSRNINDPWTGETALTFAVKLGDYVLVSLLCRLEMSLHNELANYNQGRLNLNRPNRQNETPIFLAMKLGHKKIVKLLLRYNVDLMAMTTNHQTFLSFFDYEQAQKFINKIMGKKKNDQAAVKELWTQWLLSSLDNKPFNKRVLFNASANLWRMSKSSELMTVRLTEGQANSPLILAMYAHGLASHLPINNIHELPWIMSLLGMNIHKEGAETLAYRHPLSSRTIEITNLKENSKDKPKVLLDGEEVVLDVPVSSNSIFSAPFDLGLMKEQITLQELEMYFKSWQGLFAKAKVLPETTLTSTEQVKTADNQEFYVHSMAYLDGAFRALELDRMQATRLILEKIAENSVTGEAVREAIAVQWLHTIINLEYNAALELNIAWLVGEPKLAAVIKLKKYLYKEIIEQEELTGEKFYKKLGDLFAGILKHGKIPEICKRFALLQLATPAQYTNSLAFIEAYEKVNLPQGGMAIALARALGKKLRIWIPKIVEAPNLIPAAPVNNPAIAENNPAPMEIIQKFVDQHPMSEQAINLDLLQHIDANDRLVVCARLNASAELKIKSIYAHAEVMPHDGSSSLNLSYSAWLKWLASNNGLTDKEDLLARIILAKRRIFYNYPGHNKLSLADEVIDLRQNLASQFLKTASKKENIFLSAINKIHQLAVNDYLDNLVVKNNSFIKRKENIIAELTEKVKQIIAEQQKLHATKIATLEQKEQEITQELNQREGVVKAEFQRHREELNNQLGNKETDALNKINNQLVAANVSAGLSAVLTVANPMMGIKNVLGNMAMAGAQSVAFNLLSGAKVDEILKNAACSAISAGFAPVAGADFTYSQALLHGVIDGLAQAIILNKDVDGIIQYTCAGVVKGLLTWHIDNAGIKNVYGQIASHTIISGLRCLQQGGNREAIVESLIIGAAGAYANIKRAEYLADLKVQDDKNKAKEAKQLAAARAAQVARENQAQEEAKAQAAADANQNIAAGNTAQVVDNATQVNNPAHPALGAEVEDELNQNQPRVIGNNGANARNAASKPVNQMKSNKPSYSGLEYTFDRRMDETHPEDEKPSRSAGEFFSSAGELLLDLVFPAAEAKELPSDAVYRDKRGEVKGYSLFSTNIGASYNANTNRLSDEMLPIWDSQGNPKGCGLFSNIGSNYNLNNNWLGGEVFVPYNVQQHKSKYTLFPGNHDFENSIAFHQGYFWQQMNEPAPHNYRILWNELEQNYMDLNNQYQKLSCIYDDYNTGVKNNNDYVFADIDIRNNYIESEQEYNKAKVYLEMYADYDNALKQDNSFLGKVRYVFLNNETEMLDAAKNSYESKMQMDKYVEQDIKQRLNHLSLQMAVNEIAGKSLKREISGSPSRLRDYTESAGLLTGGIFLETQSRARKIANSQLGRDVTNIGMVAGAIYAPFAMVVGGLTYAALSYEPVERAIGNAIKFPLAAIGIDSYSQRHIAGVGTEAVKFSLSGGALTKGPQVLGKAVPVLFSSGVNGAKYVGKSSVKLLDAVKNKIIIFRNRDVTYYPSKLRLQLEMLRTQYRQQSNWKLPFEIENKKLRSIVMRAYRENAKFGSGSTADAARIELDNISKMVGGRAHIQKSNDLIAGLTNLLKNEHLSAHDRMIAENVRLDLLDGLGEKLWYSQTITPKDF